MNERYSSKSQFLYVFVNMSCHSLLYSKYPTSSLAFSKASSSSRDWVSSSFNRSLGPWPPWASRSATLQNTPIEMLCMQDNVLKSFYFSLVYLKQLNYNENKDNVNCRSEWPHVWLGFSDWLRCREHLGQPFMLTNTPLTSLKWTLHGCFSTSLQAQREHENSTQKGSSLV